MAAGAAPDFDTDLDVDLAFDLQMEEAIAASLALLPSTSHSPPPSTSSRPSAFPDDDYAGYENGDVAASSDNGALVDEFEFDRRLRDHMLAGGIINISEDKWGGYGDVFRRPDDTDVSAVGMNCNALFNPEYFRLYFKGLVREESVGDAAVVVAGVGAAVCDSSDTLLIEVMKPLEAVRENEGLSPEIAELMALVEGLEAALAFALERIAFFCDDYMLYQYVTGRLRPSLNKVASLVDKVALLRGKFTSCEPLFMARDDVKFASEFAKRAIASQITLPAAETGKDRNLLENCGICYEDIELGQMFTVDGCLHRYCFSCMKKHVELKFLDGSEAKCPHEGCESTVSIESCEKLLPPKIIEVIRQRSKESSIPVSEKVYCPHPRCSALMSKTEVLEYTKDMHGNAEQSGARKCMKCHGLFCIKCKISWHDGMTCEDYQNLSHNTQTEDAKLNSMATEKLWRSCARCSHLVELAEGCYHITCRCGYEFCYTCGAEWSNKKPTCSCPIWDEHNIIRDE